MTTCKNCIYWGINDRGEKTAALLRPADACHKELHKLCLKQAGKYTRETFNCAHHQQKQIFP